MYSGRDSGYSDDQYFTRRSVDSFCATQSELHTACKSGTFGDVLNCLQSSTSSIQWYHDGHTPIHVALLSAREDVCDVIIALLDYGADINAQTTVDGNTPLHLAVLHGGFPRNFGVIKYLLARKVDVTIRNKTLRTPYDCAIAIDQHELAQAIDGVLSPEKALESYRRRLGQIYGPFIIEAVLASQEDRLKEYTELGGDPNTVNKYRDGAIHYAVTHSKLPVYNTLSHLLKAGADPNLRDEEDDTALNLVIKSKRLSDSGQMIRCVQLLLDAGADPNIQNWDGKDALTLAEENNYIDVLKILKQKTPIHCTEDVNSPNSDGLYPIHEATLMENMSRRHSKINSVVAKGAEISSQITSTGNTALHLCAEKDYGDTATVLLDHHIDHTVKNKNGMTAYEMAKELGHKSVAIAIEKKQGAKDNWKKARKKTKMCVLL